MDVIIFIFLHQVTSNISRFQPKQVISIKWSLAINLFTDEMFAPPTSHSWLRLHAYNIILILQRFPNWLHVMMEKMAITEPVIIRMIEAYGQSIPSGRGRGNSYWVYQKDWCGFHTKIDQFFRLRLHNNREWFYVCCFHRSPVWRYRVWPVDCGSSFQVGDDIEMSSSSLYIIALT